MIGSNTNKTTVFLVSCQRAFPRTRLARRVRSVVRDSIWLLSRHEYCSVCSAVISSSSYFVRLVDPVNEVATLRISYRCRSAGIVLPLVGSREPPNESGGGSGKTLG